MQVELDEKQRFDLRLNKPNEKSTNKDQDLFLYYSSQEAINKLFEKIQAVFKLSLNDLKYIGRGGGSFIIFYELSIAYLSKFYVPNEFVCQYRVFD